MAEGVEILVVLEVLEEQDTLVERQAAAVATPVVVEEVQLRMLVLAVQVVMEVMVVIRVVV